MKTSIFVLFLLFVLEPSINILNSFQNTNEIFIGVYDGLTEDMEFQFTTNNDQVYLFDEVEENLEYDLYDEINFNQKFKVTWQKRVIEILDDEDEPTGETEEIKVILSLQKL
jgi:hypothetical protein